MWFLGAAGLELFVEGVEGNTGSPAGPVALTWQTCYARLSPGPVGPAHTDQNTA